MSQEEKDEDLPLRCDAGTAMETDDPGSKTLTCGETGETITVRSSGHVDENEAHHVLDASEGSGHWVSLAKFQGAEGAYSADANSPMIRGANNEPYQGEFVEIVFPTPRRIRQYAFRVGQAHDPLPGDANVGMPLEWTLLGSDTGAQGTWESVHVGKTTESVLLRPALSVVRTAKADDVIRLRNHATNTYLAIDSQGAPRLMGRAAQNTTWKVKSGSGSNQITLESVDCKGIETKCFLAVDGGTIKPAASGTDIVISAASGEYPNYVIRLSHGEKYLKPRRATSENPAHFEFGDGSSADSHWVLETTKPEHADFFIGAVASSGELTTGAASAAHKHFRFLFTKSSGPPSVRVDVLNVFTGAGSTRSGPRWVTGSWPECEAGDPGDRVITRSITCKHDGEEVAEELCPEDAPSTSQSCDQWRENRTADARSSAIEFLWQYGIYIGIGVVLLIVIALMTGGSRPKAGGVIVDIPT